MTEQLYSLPRSSFSSFSSGPQVPAGAIQGGHGHSDIRMLGDFLIIIGLLGDIRIITGLLGDFRIITGLPGDFRIIFA